MKTKLNFQSNEMKPYQHHVPSFTKSNIVLEVKFCKSRRIKIKFSFSFQTLISDSLCAESFDQKK